MRITLGMRRAEGSGPDAGGAAQLLGGLCFGSATGGSDDALLRVEARQLAPAGLRAAVLTVDQAVSAGRCGRVSYRSCEQLLFGRVLVEETADADGGLEALTAEAYRAVFETMDTLGYPTLVRVWNYLPDINRSAAGVERYRRFNAGRQQAFSASGRPLAGNVPAACALGTRTGPLAIAFLASRGDFIAVENPRQLSAYHYPPDYGEQSPTFSRAGVLRLPGCALLFVSGTAAIVGHRSLHAGQVVAQAQEAMANIAAVLAEADARVSGTMFDPARLDYTVYVRHASEIAQVQAALGALIPAASEVLFVEADICRSDLLVEIEAWGQATIAGEAA